MKYIDDLRKHPKWFASAFDVLTQFRDSPRALINIAYALLVQVYNQLDGYGAYAVDGAISSLLDFNVSD